MGMSTTITYKPVSDSSSWLSYTIRYFLTWHNSTNTLLVCIDLSFHSKKNIARFEQFVKKMNNQKIDLDNMDTQLENLKAQKESLNKGLSDIGLESVENIAADESLKIQQISSEENRFVKN